jgi:hypothetical protein
MKYASFIMYPVAACDVWGERIPLHELNNVSEPTTTTVTEYERVEPDSPHIAHWSVYGRTPAGPLEHIADCATEEKAGLVLAALEELAEGDAYWNADEDADEDAELEELTDDESRQLWELSGEQYGENQGKYLVVSEDGENELSGPLSLEEARKLIADLRKPV